MTENVASLFGAAPIGVARVDERIVERLEGLLVMAREGKLHGFLYAMVEMDGSTGTGWCGDAEDFRMVAAVNRLFFRYSLK